MTDRRTGVTVPSFFIDDKSPMDRVPIEHLQQMRGLNSNFFENDDPNLASDTAGYSYYWAVRRGAAGDGFIEIDWSYWGAQDFTD